jgi:hypothetical protein
MESGRRPYSISDGCSLNVPHLGSHRAKTVNLRAFRTWPCPILRLLRYERRERNIVRAANVLSAAKKGALHNVVRLPSCRTCKSPMRLFTVIRDEEGGPATRVLECAVCRAKMVRHPVDRAVEPRPL